MGIFFWIIKYFKLLLKRIFRKIFRPNPAIGKHELLIAKGNLVVDKSSRINDANITIFGETPGFSNVIVGKDCFINGNIVIHSPTAKIIIGDRVFIGPDTTLFCRESIKIDDDVMISWGCTIIDTNAHSLLSDERAHDVINWKKGWQYKDWSVVENAPIEIGAKSWIGFNSIVTKGVVVANGTVVGCGSVVTKSTQPFSVVGGNPAILIKMTK